METGEGSVTRPPAERFWEKVDTSGDCWEWTASLGTTGYGTFRPVASQSMVKAHRWAYETLIGPIPDGLQLDHLCRNTACVNPAHLEPVTVRENILRGEGIAARNAAKEFCIRGHPYDEKNTQVRPVGGRNCRTCHAEIKRARRWWLRQLGDPYK